MANELPEEDLQAFEAIMSALYELEDPARFEAWAQELLAWEGRIADGTLEQAEQVPGIYSGGADVWPPEAYQFLRHHSMAWINRYTGFAAWAEPMLSIMERARGASPDEYAALRRLLDEGSNRFESQSRNAYSNLRHAETVVEPRQQLSMVLTGYALLFETELPIWFLGVLSMAAKTSRLRPNAFGGPDTATAQGSLMGQVGEAVVGGPFHEPFAHAVNTQLRHAVAHNDYDIIAYDGVLWVRELSTGRSWSDDEVYEIVQRAQVLHQSVTLAVSLSVWHDAILAARGQDAGTLSLSMYARDPHEPPYLVIPQLWCFYDLDPTGSWLNAATFRITTEDPIGRTTVSTHCSFPGVPPDHTILNALAAHRWVIVHRFSVTPAIGQKYPRFTSIDGQEYEVLGPSTEHMVPVEFFEASD